MQGNNLRNSSRSPQVPDVYGATYSNSTRQQQEGKVMSRSKNFIDEKLTAADQLMRNLTFKSKRIED
jgi:hypothetical protein